MRVREENRNMLLLASVTMLSVAIAGGAALLEPGPAAVKKPVYVTERTTTQPAPPPDQRPVYLTDQIPARVIGTPFVPNTHPRER